MSFVRFGCRRARAPPVVGELQPSPRIRTHAASHGGFRKFGSMISASEFLMRSHVIGGLMSGHNSWRPTVLVIEDEEVIRMALAESLREIGFDVRHLGDGRSAR